MIYAFFAVVFISCEKIFVPLRLDYFCLKSNYAAVRRVLSWHYASQPSLR